MPYSKTLYIDIIVFVISICTETGGLFGLAVRLMQLFSDNKRWVYPPREKTLATK